MEAFPDDSLQERRVVSSGTPLQPSPDESTPFEEVVDLPFPLPLCQPLLQLTLPEKQGEAKQCLAALRVVPTADQWKMILSPTPSTYVIAGAGSGKSTTLILRLVVLHKLLGIPLEEMHVFSFTRASTKDFRRKLSEKLISWEEVVEQRTITDRRRLEIEELVRDTVSTFHSVISRLKRHVLPAGGPLRQFFDLLRDAPAEEEEDNNYNPFVNTNLSHAQVELLNAAHTLAYQRFPRYEELITSLVLEQERQMWVRAARAANQDEQLEQWKWDQLLRQELAYHGFTDEGCYAPLDGYPDLRGFQYVDPYRAAVADRLRMWNVSFSTLSLFPIRCPLPGGFPGELYATFKVGERLFVHVERYRPPRPWKGIERSLSFHERDRRRFIALYSENPDLHKILGPEDFDISGKRTVLTTDGDFKLQYWLNLSGYALSTISAPSVRIQLPGDLHRAHIAEVLYQEGLFIESLGLEVEQLQKQDWHLDPTSEAVAEALPFFWQAFQEQLTNHRLVRFHDVLRLLREEHTLHRLRGKLGHLQHLFIDEFQDISPELVDWLAKTVRVHAKNGAECSVTAIGDDYQSIYGWRGSHPTFLMHFDRYFPAQAVGQVTLVDNFRSRQSIIDAAEAVLEPVKYKIFKHGHSRFLEGEGDRLEPVRLVEAPLSWKSSSRETDLWRTFCTYVTELLHDLENAGRLSRQIGSEKRTLSVFILARTNLTLAGIPEKDILKRHLFQALRQQDIKQFQCVDIRQGTFHRSKGLEADVVLLLDDSLPPEEHPLRERVFSQLAFLQGAAATYTQAMSDEARRLAYVALTRARLAVMWLPSVGSFPLDAGDEQSAARGNRQRDISISAQGCFTAVKRYLYLRG